jgi:hypothetical protein
MQTSLLKTLATKHRKTVNQVAKRYQASLEVHGKKYSVLQVSVPREGKKPLVATWGGIPLEWNPQATLDEHAPKLYTGRTELEKRLLAEVCELCGSAEDVEVHHMRAMKDLHEYPGLGHETT